MSREPFSPQTSNSVRNFDTWFGAIFLGVGLAALAFGLLLFRILDGAGAGEGAWLALGIPTLVGTIFLVIGGFFFRNGLAKRQREERLRHAGTTVEATVTAVEPTGTVINSRRLWRVHYAYTAHTGATFQGDSGYLEEMDARSYRPGQTVFVRYDPEQPSESSWLGREELA